MDEFTWKSNDQGDDLTCKMGKFTLRVEQMDSRMWWWAIHLGTMQIDPLMLGEKYPTTKKKAIARAEAEYCLMFCLEHNDQLPF